MIPVPIYDPVCITFSLKKNKNKFKCDICMFNKNEQKLKYTMSKFTFNNASKFSEEEKYSKFIEIDVRSNNFLVLI